ncbi:MAG: amidohydrolase [Acidobacteriota bacterium]|nr:MAG: amidohydrolase [Acidobacteriota bacterium]
MGDEARSLAESVLVRDRAAREAAVAAHQQALHRFPELAFEEHRTADYVEQALRSLGLEPKRGVVGTGLIVELPAAGTGPTVLVRADMDGLPIEEHAGHDPRSEHAGRMHACGHDGHMAIVLGIAHAVCRSGLEQALPGRLLLLFQPAEEGGAASPSGAQRIVASGLLDQERVDYVLGLHLWSYLPLGQVIIPDGTVMASSDEFRIVLRGGGGHAAVPHQASDVVLAASELVVTLQSIVAREVDPVRPAVVSVGTLHAGTAPNVLPERAELTGTLRAPDAPTRELLRRRVAEIARAVAGTRGLTVDVELGLGYPPTVNDAQVAARVRDAVRPVFGEGVLSGPPTMASEDFACYLEQRPGAFCLLGMQDPAAGAIHAHHSPQFVIAPRALPLGVELLLRGALALIEPGAGPIEGDARER